MHWYGDYRARNLQQEVYETKLEITIFPTSRLTKFKLLHLNNPLHTAQEIIDLVQQINKKAVIDCQVVKISLSFL